MEFGIHDDYVPDYGVIYGLKQPFYLFDPCEENYKFVFFITEFGSFITSFFLFIPHIYVNVLFPKKFLPETHQIAKNLMFSGIASLFYHGYVSYFTQFMDMVTIMWTLMHVIEDLNIPFTQKQEYILIQIFFLGMFHPLLTAFSLLYLIFKVGGFLLKKSIAIGRYIAFTPVILILISFSMIILDIMLCPYQIFRYFHAIWHITAFMSFCFLILEVEFHIRSRNKYTPLQRLN